MRNINNNLKQFFLTFLTLFIWLSAKGQQVLEGIVKDNRQNPVSYCSIGIKNSRVATVADENGNFKLTIPDSLANSNVVFSAIGFIDQQFEYKEPRSNAVIILKEKVIDMAEVTIKGTQLKQKTIGQQSRPMITFSKMFDQHIPSIEQGSIFEIYGQTLLKGYNFYIMPSSRFSSITLKLNVYKVKNNLPDSSVLRKHITYQAASTGWQHIDLAPYQLSFEGLDKIAITLQLVEHVPDSNNNFVFGVSAKKTIAKDLLFRYQSQGNWESNAGTFIANVELKYATGSKNKNTAAQSEVLETTEVKMLANYYLYKQAASKSSYGKDKSCRYIDLGDAKIYTEAYGKGEPLVLLHGNNGSIEDFYHQIPVFSKYFRVIAIDTRGQGRSTDLSDQAYSYDGFARDLYKVIDAMQLKKVNILGWSDGGNTALSFSLAHPEAINKIITIGANLDPSGISDSLLTSLRNRLAVDTLSKDHRLIRLMLEHPQMTAKQLRQVANPVLVVAGSQDVIKPEHTKLIASQINKSQLRIIDNASHYVPFEQPDQLNQIILDFLNNSLDK